MGSRELNTYLTEVLDKPFELGQHDCLIFSNTCWHKMFGFGWADDLLSLYMKDGKPIAKSRLQAKYKKLSILEEIDLRMNREWTFPRRGALVAIRTDESYIGHALGIANGHRAAFVSEQGLKYIPIEDVHYSWDTELKGRNHDV